MITIADLYFSKGISRNFIAFCSCAGTAKAKEAEALFNSEEIVSLARYIIPLIRCKGFLQWQGRALALKVPSEAVLATRSAAEAIKLIALKYISTCQIGDPISADLKSRERFIDANLTNWMSQ